MPKRVLIIRDPLFLLHDPGLGHPENPDRLRAIENRIDSSGFAADLRFETAREAEIKDLLRIHEAAYVDKIAKTAGTGRTEIDSETIASPESYRAALRAAGAAIQAAESVFTGQANAAFALLRPPGHHAEQDRGMGFCFFNNAAVAAAFALERLGLEKILIFDWDVHHGNGTMHSFYTSKDVMYQSIHEFPHYPGTGRIEECGAGEGAGYTINLPLSGGAGDAEYLYCLNTVFLPLGRKYRPDLIIVSAGFDPHRDDPLSSMQLSENGFAKMTAALRGLASETCGGRIIFLLEGGYNLKALADSVHAVAAELLKDEQSGGEFGLSRATDEVLDLPETAGNAMKTVSALKTVLSKYWEPF